MSKDSLRQCGNCLTWTKDGGKDASSGRNFCGKCLAVTEIERPNGEVELKFALEGLDLARIAGVRRGLRAAIQALEEQVEKASDLEREAVYNCLLAVSELTIEEVEG
jgi:hypothetical protein